MPGDGRAIFKVNHFKPNAPLPPPCLSICALSTCKNTCFTRLIYTNHRHNIVFTVFYTIFPGTEFDSKT